MSVLIPFFQPSLERSRRGTRCLGCGREGGAPCIIKTSDLFCHLTFLIPQLYLCGSGKMANSVKDVLVRLVGDRLQVGPVVAKEKFNHIINGRFATDVFE